MTQTATVDRHEEFTFAVWSFDITALRQLLADLTEEAPRISVRIEGWTWMLASDPTTGSEGQRTFPLVGVGVDWERVDAMPLEALDTPLFVAPMGEMGHLPIDGWHRIAKARRHNLAALPAIMLTREQVTSILIPGSPELPAEREVV